MFQKYFSVDFLTHKQKKNEEEVPQYYIEGDHEAIIEMFNAVQNEKRERAEAHKG